MGKKKTSKRVLSESESESSSSTGEEAYHVEVFYAVKAGEEHGKWEYFVKWAYYEEDASTWEPEEHVQECTRLLDSFWNHVYTTQRLSKETWEPGIEIKPTQQWIDSEKAYFHKMFSKEGKPRKKKEGRIKEPKKNKAVTKKHKREISSNTSKGKEKEQEATDSEEDVVLTNISKQRKSKRKAVSMITSSDSDDEPLINASVKLAASQTSAPTGSSKRLKLDDQKTAERDDANSRDHLNLSSPESPRTSISHQPYISSPSLLQGPSTPGLAKQELKRPVLTERSSTVGSSLSTKARLGQVGGILQPASARTLPKFVKKSATSVESPSLGPREDTLRNQQAREIKSPSLSQTVTVPAPPRIRPPRPADLIPKVPTPHPSPDIPRKTISTPTLPSPLANDNSLKAQALELLADIMPNELKSSLDEPNEEVRDEILPPQASLSTKPPAVALPQLQSSKVWTWNGDMYWGSKTEETKPQCKITIKEPSQPRLHTKLELRWAMQEPFIKFERLHGAAEIELLLPMWAPVQQFAKVAPSDDPTPLNALATYLTIRNCFACTPIMNNEVPIAHIVLFSSESKYLVNRLRCPISYKSCLIVALFILRESLTRKDESGAQPENFCTRPKEIMDKEKVTSFIEDSRWNQLAQQQPLVSRAIRALNFPKSLWDHLSRVSTSRTYCVWDNTPDTNTLPDTRMLLGIVAETKAKRVETTSPARVVFIHVSALKALIHASPAVLQRMNTNPEIDVYVYGTHPSVPRCLWGVQNIFPLGGIVTFTPEFLKERHLSALELVKKVHEHKLWSCYVLPVVLGRAAALAAGETKELSAFDNGTLPLYGFLQAIEEGQIALMQAPSMMNSNDEWIGAQTRTLISQTRSILEDSVNAYRNFKESIASEYRIAASIETQISKDLCNMRIEPGIIVKYRRFVVLSHCKRLSDRAKDGLDWLTFEQFSFNDDFFATPDP